MFRERNYIDMDWNDTWGIKIFLQIDALIPCLVRENYDVTARNQLENNWSH